jgi:acyl dehydratase
VRFTAPVLPGDALDFELWRESATRWRLRGRVAERNLTVIDNGIVELTEA